MGILKSQRGIALLLVMWVLTILMVIVISFSFTARTETLSTVAFKEGVEKKFLAEAGMERAVTELFYRKMYKAQAVTFEGAEIWKADGTPYTGQVGDGGYRVKMVDESGKIDINSMTEVSGIILKNLLMNAGVAEADADIIVDSVLDWKDPDDLHRLHGAESDYYMSLPTPYKAKDADFDTVEELLLVRGMKPEILHGSGERKGIIDFLTVNAKSAQININAAPTEVLLAIPGVTPDLAESIISLRQTKELLSAQEAGLPAESTPFVTTGGGNSYAIEAVGYKGEEKAGYVIKATVMLMEDNKSGYLSYKSPTSQN